MPTVIRITRLRKMNRRTRYVIIVGRRVRLISFQPNSQTKTEDNENSTTEKEDLSEKECHEETKENSISEEKKKPVTITP